MKKITPILLAALVTIVFLQACDVHRKNHVADGSAVARKEAADKAEQAQAAIYLKDSTTVAVLDTLHNFGAVPQGKEVVFAYRFVNTGKYPLVITNATASCGCTIPQKPEAPIKPGDSGVIKVVFNTAGRSLHQEKTVHVRANTTAEFPVLKLVGDVLAN
jgi:hypothetical protein